MSKKTCFDFSHIKNTQIQNTHNNGNKKNLICVISTRGRSIFCYLFFKEIILAVSLKSQTCFLKKLLFDDFDRN